MKTQIYTEALMNHLESGEEFAETMSVLTEALPFYELKKNHKMRRLYVFQPQTNYPH